jgi:hypothetical protein
MPAPERIKRMIEVFERNLPAYKSPGYKEANLRSEFIEPFFEELGWDVHNKQGWAEAYKDVINEDAIKIGGYTKAPDYCFRIGGARKFFLEAKKPSVDIKEGVDPAYQLRRYAWSADLPLSILTDVEEFAVYNCRVRPQHKDKPGKDRVMYVTYKEYLDKWDEIAAVFSRKAVMEGLFDKYAESVIGRRTTQEVDVEFLKEIEAWRTLLAKSIAIHNPSLTIRELNYTVEKTIDRIIFLRICEDRGIEQYGQLQALLNGQNIYKRLGEIFQKADEKYNSGLFHFRQEKEMVTPPDLLTPRIKIDDQALKDILANLYYPESPYEFSVLGVDILGNIYEQFLGKVIRLTAGHHAVVEEKPEVRKAGGVYYTPTYIVDYIVKNTVGKLCEEKTPKQIEKLKILDPACGSGSFLIGAYAYFLNYHRDWYVNHLLPQQGFEGVISKAALRKLVPGAKPEMPIYQGKGGQWYLSTREKKRILLNNIHGVDIDSQAVEVTKLSLLLKVLENENQDTLDRQMKLWRERALPDLGNNIKCGNSLIGPDIYEMELEVADREKINAFDWKAEFPEVMKSGGFDAVIGNPPYGAGFSETAENYFAFEYAGLSTVGDSFELFLLKASDLLKDSGRLSFIIPASWLTGESYLASRRHLLKVCEPLVAYALPFDVFRDAYIDTSIVVLARTTNNEACLVHYFPKKEILSSIPESVGIRVPIRNLRNDKMSRLSPILSSSHSGVLAKLTGTPMKYGDWFGIQRGVQPYSRKKHSEDQIEQRFLHADSKLNAEYLPELQGSELSRYFIEPKRKSFIRYCPQIASIRPMNNFQGKRIVLRRLLTRKFRLQASLTNETMITTDNVLNMVPSEHNADVEFALGILNSRLISWYYVSSSITAQKDDFPQVYISALAALPIPAHDKEKRGKMVELVDQMLLMQQQLRKFSTPPELIALQRDIATTDDQIDRLVYELYGLTEEEIKFVGQVAK